jgi:hypothetical protein
MDWNTSTVTMLLLHGQLKALFQELLTPSEDITAADYRKQPGI